MAGIASVGQHAQLVFDLYAFVFILLLGTQPRTFCMLAKCSPIDPAMVDLNLFIFNLKCTYTLHICPLVSVGSLFQDALWLPQLAGAQVSYTAEYSICT